jgi:AcrR family transcriptional regulator
MTSVNPPSARPRGRPRSASARDAALRIASDLITREGIGAVTMEAVARLSGVGKPTLYRNWRNREELAMAALMSDGVPKTSVRETNTPKSDLLRHVMKVVSMLTSPSGRSAALMVASADPDSELSKAFRNQIMLASREEGRVLLQRILKHNGRQRTTDIEATLDMIYGPIFYRLLIGHRPVNEAFAKAILAEII